MNTSLKYLKGIGDKRSKVLADELNLHTFRDLLYYFPYRHIDRSRMYKISELLPDMPYVQILGFFRTFTVEGEGAKKRLKGVFCDGSRLMEIIWFSKIDVIRGMLKPMKQYVVFGKPTEFRGHYSMAHPEIEEYNPEKPPAGFVGVYSLTDKLRRQNYTPRFFSKEVSLILENEKLRNMVDALPRQIVERHRMMTLQEALHNIHLPQSAELLSRATARMKFEELFFLQLKILAYSKHRNHQIRGHRLEHIGAYFNNFYNNHIPFELTGAQKRVLKEIRADMNTGRQMNRLLQGDVGCGKTMVAFMTMLMALDNGFQAAIIAPTEILAQQHYETIGRWAERLEIKCALLTGNTRVKERREIDENLRTGELQILIGTHALLEEKVVFRNLGIAVIDEQHRFGVAQRAKMWQKNQIPPHVLVMTATPIPRTLAMTVYGDLEVSVINELPPGRTPVQTVLYTDLNRMQMVEGVKSQLRQGRQVYMVFPLVKENEKLSLKSVEAGYEDVSRAFSNYTVCCVHGQMKPADKEREMQKFISGEAQIMVATTVIEVGVNVPNATVMVIENAERFGLSQLHQLRGRVGRGADRSFCILMSKQKIASDTRKRLKVMTETTDGFVVAEADMKMRGPGDMEGTQQSGMAFDLHIANLTTDGRILALARAEASDVLDANPELCGMSQLIETNDGEYISANGDKIKIRPDYRLNSSQKSAIVNELNIRFGRDLDWSQIS